MWSPSEKWRRRHNQNRVYRIRLRADIDEAAWADLEKEHGVGTLALGGVSLARVSHDLFDAISGGEDAFDSLDYAINEVLADISQGMEVVEEERLS